MWSSIINECKRKREEMHVYKAGSQELKDAHDFLVGCFSQFSMNHDGQISTPHIDLSKIPHWVIVDSNDAQVRNEEIASFQQSIRTVVSSVKICGLSYNGSTFYLKIPSEREIRMKEEVTQTSITQLENELDALRKKLDKYKKMKGGE